MNRSGLARAGLTLVLLTAAATGGVYGVSTAQDDVYETKARFVIGPATLAAEADLVDSAAALDRRSIITTYAEIVEGSIVVDQSAAAAGVPDPDAYDSRGRVVPGANVVELTVTGPDAATTALLATEISTTSIAYFQDLYRVYRVQLLEEPVPSDSPVSPEPARDAVLAGAAGAILAAVIIYGRGWLRERPPVTTPREGSPIDVTDADGAATPRSAQPAGRP